MDGYDALSELRAIVYGLVGGGRYGMKIRLPHAAVMTLLFRKNTSFEDKVKIVLKSTYEHSRNLASFAAIYKTLLFVLKLISSNLRNVSPESRKNVFCNLGRSIALFLVDGPTKGRRLVPRPPGTPERTQHAAISGAIGGYLVWSNPSSINYQIVLYLTSRIVTGMVLLARKKGIPPFSSDSFTFANVYPIKAAVVWGTVMALFESCPEVLHPSLKKSMDEVYRLDEFEDRI